MEITALQYFQEVYLCRNISTASKNCFISQQALSKVIINLENELNTQLFIRSHSGVIPTREADNLYELCKPLLHQWKQFNDSIANLQPHIRFGFPCHSFADYGIFSLNDLYAYQQKYNQFIDLCFDSQIVCLDRILSEKMDLACVIAPVSDADFEQVHLYTGELGLLVNKDNPLFSKEKLCFEDLANEAIVSATDMPDSSSQLDLVINKNGTKIKPIQQTFSLKSGIAAVESNIASVFLDIQRKNEIDSSKLKLIEFQHDSKLFYHIYLIWKKNRKLSFACSRFKDFLIQCCRDKK